MKHTFNKLLCLVLALVMVIGMLPATMFASAADVVVMNANQLLVDDDFDGIANKVKVQATVGGVVYEAVMGDNAFTSIAEAISKASLNTQIYVAAGTYSENFNITQNMEIYGNGMNVNPNNEDWSANAKRADLTKETVLHNSTVGITAKGATNVVFNGFSFTGKSSLKETTSGSTIKGMDISYNCFYDNEQISANQGVIYITGTTVRSGRIAYNRVENSVAEAKPITFRNANNFVFQGNYFNVTATVALWLTAETADKNTTPGQMRISMLDNYVVATEYAFQMMLYYANLVEITAKNNYAKAQYPLCIDAHEETVRTKTITVENNTFDGSKIDLWFKVRSGVPTYDASVMKIKNNTFVSGYVTNAWVDAAAMDLSYNTFKKTPVIDCIPSAIMYPTYDGNGNVVGAMELDSVELTGVKKSGDKSTISGVSIDNAAKTVSLKDATASDFANIEVVATPKVADSTVTAKYYKDPACTTELTGGNVVDYLKKGNNLVYIKLTTSLDNYSFVVYTLTIPREASHEALVTGVEDYVNTVSDHHINVEIPATEINPNILLEVSLGATYKIYADADLKKPVGGTVINNLAAGSTTYYVEVIAEDGETSDVYSMTLIRAPYAATDIIKFNSPEFVTYDNNEEAYLAVYSSKYESVDVDVEVSERATWQLYLDPTCKKAVDSTGIALKTGDNVYYIKVVSEAAAAEKIYKVIFRKESADASKQIYSVTSDAASSSVTADTVTIKLDSKVTDYTPAFDYAGAYWKLYTAYTDGVLSGVVANNLIKDVPGGNHTYYIEVVAVDKSTRVYTLELDREFADDALLLAIGGGTSSYVDRFDFVATTEVKDEGLFTPSFTVSDKATVKVLNANGAVVTLPLNLRAGVSQYTIVVTAENGEDKTEYEWTITCIGDNVATLSVGVAYDPSWADKTSGEVIYAPINGEVVKVYYGENAFAVLSTARTQAASKGGILYVMPGVTIDDSIAVSGIKLYGANFAVDPNTSNRYPESVLTERVVLSGENAAVCGFTFATDAWINVANKATDAKIANNIFVDEAERSNVAISMAGSTAYDNITIQGNRFEVNSTSAAISMNNVGNKNVVADNYFTNVTNGAMLTVKKMAAGSTLDFNGNRVEAKESTALWFGSADQRAGFVNVRNNIFASNRAISMDASKATDAFVMNFYNNKVETEKLAVKITGAPASFATNFTANENTFSSIDRSFSIDYATKVQVAGLTAMDLERNYYGTATPGNDVFDTTYSYKPYYLDADKTYLSNIIQPTVITAGGREILEDGTTNFAILPSDTADVAIKFMANANLPVNGFGYAYVSEDDNFTADTITVTVDGKKKVYACVTSVDETAVEITEVDLYIQTANPVYNVYEVISSTISEMTVRIVVDHKATVWTPALAIINNLAIDFYADADCTKALNTIELKTAKTTVYGLVEGYEPVEFVIYKKQSSEKAILSIADAYTFEYTGSTTAELAIDNRLTVADLTATVSDNAWYEVYSDAACTAVVDESQVANTVTKLYYKVTAADDTEKVFEVNISWIDVVDPDLLGVKGTKNVSATEDQLVVLVEKYDANEGFVTELVTNPGCTYKLYIDEDHESVYKNDTVFFSANYVFIYATVTSPDGVVTKDYTVVLTKDAGTIKFVDQAKIPTWAKNAVEVTKHLGIVNGEKVKGGYLLNADGKATREVMAAFMVRMMGVDASQYSYVDLESKFADADQVSAWAVPTMKAAVALGIFSGAKNGDQYYLNPKNNITRQEFATVFVRAIGAEDVDVKTYALNYKDAASIAKWARTYVKVISKLGYMKGSYGNFNPKNPVTRAEIIQTIYNYMY